MNVTLKNGAEEFGPLVAGTILTLERLFEDAPIEAYEAVQIARDRTHVPFAATGLVAKNIIEPRDEGFVMHDSTRNVILSAVRGEGFDLVLGDPIRR